MDPRDQLQEGRTYYHDSEGVVTYVRRDDSLRRSSTDTPIGVLVRVHRDGEIVLTDYARLAVI